VDAINGLWTWNLHRLLAHSVAVAVSGCKQKKYLPVVFVWCLTSHQHKYVSLWRNAWDGTRLRRLRKSKYKINVSHSLITRLHKTHYKYKLPGNNLAMWGLLYLVRAFANTRQDHMLPAARSTIRTCTSHSKIHRQIMVNIILLFSFLLDLSNSTCTDKRQSIQLYANTVTTRTMRDGITNQHWAYRDQSMQLMTCRLS